jgi:hypothetical protein
MKESVDASPLLIHSVPVSPHSSVPLFPLFRSYSGLLTPVPVFQIGVNSVTRGSSKVITCCGRDRSTLPSLEAVASGARNRYIVIGVITVYRCI